MEDVILLALLLGLAILVLYVVVRKAVHHGIIDAELERDERERRAELDRAARERPSRYVENDPDV